MRVALLAFPLALISMLFLACDDGDGGSVSVSGSSSGSSSASGASGSASGTGDESLVTDKEPKETLKVGLIEYQVKPERLSVAAGPTKFVATNESKSEVHELAVLLVKSDGSFQNTGEVEGLDPGKSGEVVLDLPAGKYVLACLIEAGESGSTKNHFDEGMKIDFEVK